jgi:hypothetical protein
MSTKREILLGRKLFQFSSKADWVSKGQGIWKLHKAGSHNAVCLDQLGRICTYGLHFAEAERDNAYPIEVYMVRPEQADDTEGGAA